MHIYATPVLNEEKRPGTGPRRLTSDFSQACRYGLEGAVIALGELDNAPDDEAEHHGADQVDADAVAVIEGWRRLRPLAPARAAGALATLSAWADCATAALLALIMASATSADNFFVSMLPPKGQRRKS